MEIMEIVKKIKEIKEIEQRAKMARVEIIQKKSSPTIYVGDFFCDNIILSCIHIDI